jgi:hypothetical protein
MDDAVQVSRLLYNTCICYATMRTEPNLLYIIFLRLMSNTKIS